MICFHDVVTLDPEDGRYYCDRCGRQTEEPVSRCCGAEINDYGYCSECSERVRA